MSLIAMTVGLVLLWPGAPPAQAQGIPTPTVSDQQGDLEQCLADGRSPGVSELAVARACAPDRAVFDDCMQLQEDVEIAPREAIATCLAGQVAETSSTSPEPTTTAASAPGELAPDPIPTATSSGAADDGTGTGTVIAIAIGAFLVGAAGAWSLTRRQSQPEPATTTFVPATATALARSATPVTAEEDRRALVAAIIEASDVVSSEAVCATLAERLEAVGVEAIDVAPGSAFDPATHRGVHAEPAPGPEQDGTVAHTDRPGWRDRGIVLRPPEVVVYRWEAT